MNKKIDNAFETGQWIGEIDTLDNDERRELREFYEAEGIDVLPRNLYFNYKTQEWI